jgi:hypothetical protein
VLEWETHEGYKLLMCLLAALRIGMRAVTHLQGTMLLHTCTLKMVANSLQVQGKDGKSCLAS